MKYIATTSLALFAFCASLAQAPALTLEECRAMALEYNYSLKSSTEQIEASRDMLDSYKSQRLPNLALSANYIYSTLSMTEQIEGGYLPTFSPDATTGELTPNIVGYSADGSPIFSSYAYMPDQTYELDVNGVFTGGVSLTQPIYMGGKISSAISLAEIGVQAAQINSQLTRQEVIVATDEAFYTYLKVEEMLKSAAKYNEVVAEFYRQVANLHKNGMCTKNDLLKVQVSLNEAELMVRKAENGLRIARMNLAHTIGLELTTAQITLVDEFEAATQIDTQNLSISSRPEYALLSKQIEAKEVQVKLTKSDYLPSLAAIAQYGYTNGVEFNGLTMLNGTSLTAAVSLNVPIFHWGEGKRKVSASRREVEIAKNQKEELSQKMTLELLQTINNYDEAQLEVAMTERSLEQAAENMRMSGKQYQSGMETLVNYLESQALWQKAMSDLTEARSAQRIAYARYCKAKGILE